MAPSKEQRVREALKKVAKDLEDLTEHFLQAEKGLVQATPTKKRVRDPDAPKHPNSNYLLFSNSIRKEVAEKNPNSTFAEKSKIYSEEWQKLTEDQKKPFTDLANKEREIFNEEMKAYENKKKSVKISDGQDKEMQKVEEEDEDEDDDEQDEIEDDEEEETTTTAPAKKQSDTRSLDSSSSEDSSSDSSEEDSDSSA